MSDDNERPPAQEPPIDEPIVDEPQAEEPETGEAPTVESPTVESPTVGSPDELEPLPPPPPVTIPVLPTVPPAAYPPPPPPPRLAPAWTPTVPTPEPVAQVGDGASPASGSGRRKWLIVVGALVVAASLVAAGAMLAARSVVEENAVQDFARAPVGCTTTLEFDRTGTFTLYLETKGSLPELSGDCEAVTPYEYGDDNEPRVNLVLVDADDAGVTVSPSDDGSYDTGDFVGSATGTVDIAAAGSYRLTVTSDATEIAIAVGNDPSSGSDDLAMWAIIVGVGGVVLGLVLILLGLRRRRQRSSPTTAPTSPTPVPTSGWQQQTPVPGAVVAPEQPPTGDASP